MARTLKNLTNAERRAAAAAAVKKAKDPPKNGRNQPSLIDPTTLDDRQLLDSLKRLGANVGPINDSTRSLYMRRLGKLIKERGVENLYRIEEEDDGENEETKENGQKKDEVNEKPKKKGNGERQVAEEIEEERVVEKDEPKKKRRGRSRITTVDSEEEEAEVVPVTEVRPKKKGNGERKVAEEIEEERVVEKDEPKKKRRGRSRINTVDSEEEDAEVVPVMEVQPKKKGNGERKVAEEIEEERVVEKDEPKKKRRARSRINTVDSEEEEAEVVPVMEVQPKKKGNGERQVAEEIEEERVVEKDEPKKKRRGRSRINTVDSEEEEAEVVPVTEVRPKKKGNGERRVAEEIEEERVVEKDEPKKKRRGRSRINTVDSEEEEAEVVPVTEVRPKKKGNGERRVAEEIEEERVVEKDEPKKKRRGRSRINTMDSEEEEAEGEVPILVQQPKVKDIVRIWEGRNNAAKKVSFARVDGMKLSDEEEITEEEEEEEESLQETTKKRDPSVQIVGVRMTADEKNEIDDDKRMEKNRKTIVIEEDEEIEGTETNATTDLYANEDEAIELLASEDEEENISLEDTKDMFRGRSCQSISMNEGRMDHPHITHSQILDESEDMEISPRQGDTTVVNTVNNQESQRMLRDLSRPLFLDDSLDMDISHDSPERALTSRIEQDTAYPRYGPLIVDTPKSSRIENREKEGAGKRGDRESLRVPLRGKNGQGETGPRSHLFDAPLTMEDTSTTHEAYLEESVGINSFYNGRYGGTGMNSTRNSEAHRGEFGKTFVKECGKTFIVPNERRKTKTSTSRTTFVVVPRKTPSREKTARLTRNITRPNSQSHSSIRPQSFIISPSPSRSNTNTPLLTGNAHQYHLAANSKNLWYFIPFTPKKSSTRPRSPPNPVHTRDGMQQQSQTTFSSSSFTVTSASQNRVESNDDEGMHEFSPASLFQTQPRLREQKDMNAMVRGSVQMPKSQHVEERKGRRKTTRDLPTLREE